MTEIKYITKSMIFAYDFCPMQFYKQYILKEKRPASPAMEVGIRFHEFAERFFGMCYQVPPEHWMNFIPSSFTPHEKEMAAYFIGNEYQRYNFYGEEDFMPMACEWWGQSEPLKIRGFIDRVDYVDKDEGTIRLIEYKTGRRAKVPQVRQELAFYSILFNDVTEHQYDVTQFGIYYPALKCYKEYPIRKRDITHVTKKWDKLKSALETNEFPEKCNEYKRAACGLCD